jgi:signal transduction histidine kinase
MTEQMGSKTVTSIRSALIYRIASPQAAPPSVRGKDVRTLKDATGKAFGEDLYKAAQDGKVNEVSYMFPKPGATEPSSKVSFVTKVGDLGCGVGYYK